MFTMTFVGKEVCDAGISVEWVVSEAHLMRLECLLAHLSQLVKSPGLELQLAVRLSDSESH